MTNNIDKKVEFYRRALLGSKYNGNPQDINSVCESCYAKAWGTMARTIELDKDLKNEIKARRKDNPEFNIPEYDILRDELKGEIVAVNSGEKSQFNIREHIRETENLTFGQVQKVVNIFFKYIYTFMDELGVEDSAFSNCDCPIDSIIFSKLKKFQDENECAFRGQNIEFLTNNQNAKSKYAKVKYNGENYVWSAINSQDLYERIQNCVDIAKGDGTRLDYDFNSWNHED